MNAIATRSNWFKNLAPFFQPVRSKGNTNRTLYARFFPCFEQVTVRCFITKKQQQQLDLIGNSELFLYNFSACGIPVKAVLLAKGLHFSNSVLNPIIYGLMNKQFKAAFRHLFRWTFYSLYGSSAHIIGANIVSKSSSLQTRLSSLKRSLGSGHSNCTANDMRSSPL